MIGRSNYFGICFTTPKRWFSSDVTAAMLVHRTIEKKVFWEFDFIIMQNMSHNLLLFCATTWPSHHVIENHLLKTALYTLFQNGRHLNILLFLIKLALDASLLSLKFKRIFYLERGNKGQFKSRGYHRHSSPENPLSKHFQYPVPVHISDARQS